MASPQTDLPTDAPLSSFLPFQALDDAELNHIRSGPRMSSCHSQPQVYYGPVSIRNYLAGHAKKTLRVPKTALKPHLYQVFVKLPIELKLVVLEHCHPIDLHHFSQTSKFNRAIVMNRKAAGVWQTAFDRHPDLPNPPPGITGAHWAFMLFGPGICQECGKHGALTDFAFRKRLCEPCMRERCAYPNVLRDTNHQIVGPDHVVLTMLPRSYRYHGLRYTAAYATPANARYLRQDFQIMIKKVTLLQLLISNEVPMISELFDEYKDALVAHVAKIQEHAEKTNSWAMDVYRKCSTEYDTLHRDIADECKKRLRNHGHETQDIDYVHYSLTHALRQAFVYRLNPRAFRKIRPRLEEFVNNRKVARLKLERQNLLESIYRDYQKSLDPDRWQYLPPSKLVESIEGFSDFLQAPYDKRGDMAPSYAVSLFPAFIADWTRTQQEAVVSLFPSTVPDQAKLEKLELATSVFTCVDCRYKIRDGRILLGWNNICRHRQFNQLASAAAESLVRCVGLDPATTTIEQMNLRDDRFLCSNCTSEPSRGVIGLKVYNWVECLLHVVEMQLHTPPQPMHSVPAWLLLTPEATRFVKEQEYAYPRAIAEIWRCNLCAIHYDDFVPQIEAIDHVQKVHLIKTPVIGVDGATTSAHVVADKRHPTRRRKPFRLGREPAYEFKCNRCPKIPICKIWEMQKLTNHLRTKHHIVEPVLEQDYTKVDIIAAAATALPVSAQPVDQGENS
ncbi:hypothetical protein M413DRAFT_438003 [Hebeloma cylindrosporum]|uniref:F-box domain-containing protein n=1 Tax=Hebeloma cylindrosporum TaxID=76867 RepID=A0A0C3CXE3_HEBCY|nr:hypothetical protein M413DRAFT_438003 [Hebeloma cylindrosporum h7]